MKKTVIALALGAMTLLPLPVSAAAAFPTGAPDAPMFTTEQTKANQWIDAMLVKQKPTDAYTLMAPAAQKQFAKDKIVKISQDLKARWGKLEALGFVRWERFTQADRMFYVMKFEKAPVVYCVLVYDKQGGLENFTLSEVAKDQPAKDQGKSTKK
ncbi:MAG: hypothetical protein PUB57_09660 [Selenomonadaceae bacterium]|nr:hypothetical protein [Selenomonadaceae bacterium]